MYAEISNETRRVIQEIANVFGSGEPVHIIHVIICDHCQRKDREAFPYNVLDAEGKHWPHLCNECFDELGCGYSDDGSQECEICGMEMTWVDCWNGCDEGVQWMYETDPLWYDDDDYEVCDICDGHGGWRVCPRAGEPDHQATDAESAAASAEFSINQIGGDLGVQASPPL